MNWHATLLAATDNVAVALQPIAAGERVVVRRPEGVREVVALEAIPLCHKIALADLATSDDVLKYGYCIGEARQPIASRRLGAHAQPGEPARAAEREGPRRHEGLRRERVCRSGGASDRPHAARTLQAGCCREPRAPCRDGEGTVRVSAAASRFARPAVVTQDPLGRRCRRDHDRARRPRGACQCRRGRRITRSRASHRATDVECVHGCLRRPCTRRCASNRCLDRARRASRARSRVLRSQSRRRSPLRA